MLLILGLLLCLSTACASDNSSDATSIHQDKSISKIKTASTPEKTYKTSSNESKSLSKVYVSTEGNDSNTGSQDSPKASIKGALDTVSQGGTIYLNSGTYNESNITINKNVAIVGNATKTTIINSKKQQTFLINSTAKLKALTITNAQTKDCGAAIYNMGTLKLEGIKIQTSYARYLGGAIYNNGTLNIIKSSFSSNNAKNGGAIFNENKLTISRSSFSNNKAKTIASAIYSTGEAKVYATEFTRNSNNTICVNKNSSINIESSTFKDNSGENGGALYNRQSTILVNKTNFNNNSANNTGGAIYSTGKSVIVNSTFSYNTAKNGGGVMNYATVEVDNSSIKHNTATEYGGFLHSTSTIMLTNNKFQENNGKYGGAVSTSSQKGILTSIDTSEFNSNTAEIGGALYVYGNNRLRIDDSLFNNNSDSALFIKSTMTENWIVNSSFTKNRAANGGAIRNDGSDLIIQKGVFSSNSATNGGALYNYKGNSTVVHSVILNNDNIDLFNNQGRIYAPENWWGSNNIGTNRTNTDIPNWVIMTLDVNSTGKVNDDAKIIVSLDHIYDGKTIEEFSVSFLPRLKMELNITGCGVNSSYSEYMDHDFVVTENFTQTGQATARAKISSQYLEEQITIKNSTISSLITGMYVQLGASVTSSDVAKWVKAGITDVFVQARASTDNTQKLRTVINLCKNTNIRVHAWIICFATNDGFDVSKKQQNMITSFIKKVIQIDGVDGISLDYVRYNGLNPSIVNPNVITGFVKDVNTIVKGYDSSLLVSAAVFAEKAGTVTYYGQDYTALSPYLDIMIPMTYKYDYGGTDTWLSSSTKYVVDRAKESLVVSAITSYKPSGSNLQVLSTSALEHDAKVVLDAGSKGYIIFRYGLLNSYPDNADELAS